MSLIRALNCSIDGLLTCPRVVTSPRSLRGPPRWFSHHPNYLHATPSGQGGTPVEMLSLHPKAQCEVPTTVDVPVATTALKTRPFWSSWNLTPGKMAEAASAAHSNIFRRHRIDQRPHLSVSAVMGSATNVYYTHWRGPRPLPHQPRAPWRAHCLFPLTPLHDRWSSTFFEPTAVRDRARANQAP